MAALTPARAQVAGESAGDLDRIDIVEKIGESIPLELTFVDDHGDSVRLAGYFGDNKPVILVLGYYSCPMLCNLVFNGVVDGINELDWKAGEEFRIITVSIDPTETPELAAAKKANYLDPINRDVGDSGWMFLTGEESQSRALAEAVGFEYFYDTAQGQYAHPAALFVLTPEGKISRYLYGIQFSKTDLKLSLLEASEGRIGNSVDRLILYCYNYDPDSRGYNVVAANVMKLGGAATLIVLTIFLGMLWYGERLRKRRRAAVSTRTDRPGERV